MDSALKQKILVTVGKLFAGGKTPLGSAGVDVGKIGRIERAHPEVAKQIPMSKREG